MNLKQILFSALSLLPTMQMHGQEVFREVDYNAERTIFRLHAPTTKGEADAANADKRGTKARKPKVTVQLYADGMGGNPIRKVRMRPAGTNLWMATVKGNLDGQFYTFDALHGETPGVFAKAVGVNGRRGAILDLKKTDPEGWKDDVRPTLMSPSDLVIYELHHRDFSIDASSGLQHKGKFLALTEPKAIAHLKKLGINAVHLLPSFDFASVDETRLDTPQYNWGYDPLNYNVPEGSYSTNPYDPATRILEFKKMVQALHKAGIRVILDVVYNHTFDLDNSNFERTYPGYFYRYAKKGQPSNGSGCGNETASEQPLMRQFMLESVKYWINEYHIDGFRFDLMGVHDIATMKAIRAEVDKIDPSIYVYGEGWSAGSCALDGEQLATKAHVGRMPGIAAFSDDLRDALRGPFSDDTKGAFLAGIPGEEESLKAGIAGMVAHPGVDYGKVNYSKEPWAEEPTQMISYVSCHDDMCLVDRLKAEMPGIGTDELIRLDLLAQTTVLTSQGVPFILSGEEMLRDKQGVHNSYNSPDSINHLDWQNLQRYPQVFAYYSGLIAMRKHHQVFRLGSADAVRKHLKFIDTQPCMVAFALDGTSVGDAWHTTIVVLNANREAREITLPAGEYTIVARDGVVDEQGMGTIAGGKIAVGAQSALILHN